MSWTNLEGQGLDEPRFCIREHGEEARTQDVTSSRSNTRKKAFATRKKRKLKRSLSRHTTKVKKKIGKVSYKDAYNAASNAMQTPSSFVIPKRERSLRLRK